jgi:hypothetical protein
MMGRGALLFRPAALLGAQPSSSEANRLTTITVTMTTLKTMKAVRRQSVRREPPV